MPENMPAGFRAVYCENQILPWQRFIVQAERNFCYSPGVQTTSAGSRREFCAFGSLSKNYEN
jgi:hypothetical protein